MKRFVIGCLLAMSAASAQASWLYWQVDQQRTMVNRGWTYTFGNQYDAGHLVAIKDGTTTTLVLTDLATGERMDYTDVFDYGENAAVDLTQLDNDGQGYSYYVEYVKYDDVGNSSVAARSVIEHSYASVSAYITGDIGLVPSAGAWHGGAMATPEPTSAVLMLLGAAGLALRRKQGKAA